MTDPWKFDMGENVWQSLAWHANDTPQPKPPEYIPGFTAENMRRFEIYKGQLVLWKIGRSEQLIRGLQPKETFDYIDFS